MQNVRSHPTPSTPAGHRLNLLLSAARWRSDVWVESLPRLLEPLGVRSFTAGSAREASEVIRREPVHIAVVDLGLPLEPGEGGSSDAGPRVLELLHRLETRPPTVVIKRTRTHRDDRRELAAALRLGAFAVMDRPSDTRDLEIMLGVLMRVLTRHYAGGWPEGCVGPGGEAGGSGGGGR